MGYLHVALESDPTIVRNKASWQSEVRWSKYVLLRLHFELLGDSPMMRRAPTPEMFPSKGSGHYEYTAIRRT
jgi:hypothetical protein